MDVDASERRLDVLVFEMAIAKKELDKSDLALQLFLSVLPRPEWGVEEISKYKVTRGMLADKCIVQMDALINMVQGCLEVSREFDLNEKTDKLQKKLQDMRTWKQRYTDMKNDPRPMPKE